MGLIQAALSAAGSVLGDQWKEYFYCDSLSPEILVAKGQKKTRSGSSNTSTDNIITNGSVIAVNNGQCMIIVDDGKVVELCAEPGQYTYDKGTAPSLFAGKGTLAENIQDVFLKLKSVLNLAAIPEKISEFIISTSRKLPATNTERPARFLFASWTTISVLTWIFR